MVALRRLKQGDHDFVARLGNTERPLFRKKTRFITNNYDLLTSSFSKKANRFCSNPKVTI